MLALVPANGLLQISSVFEQGDLTWDEKAMLACLLSRLYAAQTDLPIQTLALTVRRPVNATLDLLLSLRRRGYVKISTQTDGQHAALNIKHPIFQIRIRREGLERFIESNDKVPTSGELLQFWRDTHNKILGKFPAKDQKDLLRMRLIVRHQGPDAIRCITDYLTRFRNLPQKCNTLGLFLSYGRKKV